MVNHSRGKDAGHPPQCLATLITCSTALSAPITPATCATAATTATGTIPGNTSNAANSTATAPPPTSSSASNSRTLKNAAPTIHSAAGFSRSLLLSHCPRLLSLLCLIALLAAPLLTAARDEHLQLTPAQQGELQESEETAMPPTLTEREEAPSEDSTADSFTGPSQLAEERANKFITNAPGALADGGIKADQEMCAWMFDSLIAYFEGPSEEPPMPPSVEALHEKHAQVPAFVTWMKRRSGHWGFKEEDVNLRGCIGSLEPIPITKLKNYALLSALNDSRFNPITPSEIPELKCHVSLLHSFERGKDPYDWDVGLHGIIINFTAKGRGGLKNYQATYLPEVAAETGMSKEETITSLVRKAGYTKGPVDATLISGISLTRYQSSQARLDYDNYIKLFGHLSERKAQA
ncbi:hypothetical protein cyc_05218 [Cyclospora cayetanensis]|uniref:AMMECR1 domain-containing protein n=1 Tax=Cyclospora cayetanensis TaxID=88456 RepID=A0A1D3CRN6_9EIME|nr:hypothetical protein cyc_05218 [Cyclospora cayetanensis]